MPIKKNRPKKTPIRGIWKDGPNRFLVRVIWRDPKTGRRRKKEATTAKTFAEAVALKEQLKLTGQKTKIINQRFADYAEHWLKMHKNSFAPSSQSYYINNLAHAIGAFGNYYLDAIEPADIREWIMRSETNCDYARATVNGWIRVLRQCLDDAVEDGIIKFNPARSVKTLTEKRTKGKRGNSLSLEMFRDFIHSVEDLCVKNIIAQDLARMLLAAGWTGMRKGELMALKWTDLVDGEIQVERSVWRRLEKATKTDDPRRVTIVEPLKEILNVQRRWLIEKQHPGLVSGLVFPACPIHAKAGATRRHSDELSWYRSPSAMDKPISLVVEAAKLPLISVHSLRRTWENLLRKSGVDGLVRRAIAGWRDETTQAIYGTVNREERDAAGQAMVRLVQGTA